MRLLRASVSQDPPCKDMLTDTAPRPAQDLAQLTLIAKRLLLCRLFLKVPQDRRVRSGLRRGVLSSPHLAATSWACLADSALSDQTCS